MVRMTFFRSVTGAAVLGAAAWFALWAADSKTDTKDHAQPHAVLGVEGEEKHDGSHGAMCEEHRVPEAECGICRPELLSKLKPGEELMVRLPSAGSLQLAGITTALPKVGDIAEGIECYAEITFNQNKLAEITTPTEGIIKEVLVDPGSRVEEKQLLARVWSPSVAESVAEAVLSHQTLKREMNLRAGRVTSEKELQQAEAQHRAVCQRLRTLGFSEDQIDGFGEKPHEEVLLEMHAPFAGEIVTRKAVLGARIASGDLLFSLADRSLMWAELSVPEHSLALVKRGQKVDVTVDSMPGRTFSGNLTWVGAEVDVRSRMAKARSELLNPDGVLKANMFAKAKIVARVSEGAVAVPAEAIQQVNGIPFVFVKKEEDLFAARRIQPGARFDGQVEVLAGLKKEDLIAVKATFTLKSQLLVSKLGAGCADE
jgi:membrane fusion protein, heavy metal efflux system